MMRAAAMQREDRAIGSVLIVSRWQAQIVFALHAIHHDRLVEHELSRRVRRLHAATVAGDGRIASARHTSRAALWTGRAAFAGPAARSAGATASANAAGARVLDDTAAHGEGGASRSGDAACAGSCGDRRSTRPG